MAFASPLEMGAGLVKTAARFAWYAAQAERLKRVSKQAADAIPDTDYKIEPPTAPMAIQKQHLSAISELYKRDLANVRAGYYAPPSDEPGGLRGLISRTEAAIKDAPEVTRRRVTGSHQEVFQHNEWDKRPRYYLQNFHFQSDGWLSDNSAEIYDAQVDLLFMGTAGAMRRQALRPISEFIKGQDQRQMQFADIATGSGSFLADLCQSFPRLNITAIDLSEPYLKRAQALVQNRSHIRFCAAAAEHLPFANSNLDGASCIYLFHELPHKIRRNVATELSRTIKKGGRFVLVDSLQTGDDERFDGLLELFPQLFHEPYYRNYCEDDLVGLFYDSGFALSSASNAYLSRVWVFDRI